MIDFLLIVWGMTVWGLIVWCLSVWVLKSSALPVPKVELDPLLSSTEEPRSASGEQGCPEAEKKSLGGGA